MFYGAVVIKSVAAGLQGVAQGSDKIPESSFCCIIIDIIIKIKDKVLWTDELAPMDVAVYCTCCVLHIAPTKTPSRP